MRLLLTTDLHLTDRPEHAYRLKYLEWLCGNRGSYDAIVICGDLSDAKDHHSGRLVNAVVDRLLALAKVVPVHVLYGNHDGPSPDQAFWRFLGEIHDQLYYYTQFQRADLDDLGFDTGYMVPWGAEEQFLAFMNENPHHRSKGDAHVAFMHVTVNRARGENGTEMEGSLPSIFVPGPWKSLKVFSGDIHVPQVIGDVTYVGCPYHIHYGDGYTPRTLIYDTKTGTTDEWHFNEAPRLVTLRLDGLCDPFAEEFGVMKGDRVKIVIESKEELLPQDWQAYVKQAREDLAKNDIQLASALLERKVTTDGPRLPPNLSRSPDAIFATYCHAQRYDEEIVNVGREVIREEDEGTIPTRR